MNEEELHNHICKYLQEHFKYRVLSAEAITDTECFFVESHLFEFIQTTQKETWNRLRDEYFGSDTGRQIVKAIKDELRVYPLWLVIRNGIALKDEKIYLYTPKPRNENSAEQLKSYKANIFAYKKEFYFTQDTSEAIDLVLYLNGLPIIAAELKHHGATGEACTYADAIDQFLERRHTLSRIFTLPFAYFAADTDEVWAATNPTDEEYFHPLNTGLTNKENPEIPHGEYPVWHLYGQLFSPEYISDFIEYFLLYVPADMESQRPAYTILPRFHQLRSTRNITADLLKYAETEDMLGKKYLVHHSPGSGKTLTISWLAERLDSLNKGTTNQKVLDVVVILTDRKSLDTNVKNDLEKFVHLQKRIIYTDKAEEVAEHLHKRTNIIVTTIQKFNYVQKQISEDESLKDLHVAFIIDEAHRSQSGKMGKNVRLTFATQAEETENIEIETIEEDVEEAFRKLDIRRQVYIAFTATPIEKTIALFGKPFDVYTEDEAIKESYILDVAENVISYKTLYHLDKAWIKPDERMYPAGLIKKLLRDIAFEDTDVINYKSQVITNHFEKEIRPLLEGKSKAMVVASSRQAGYNYYLAIRLILEKQNLPYKVLFAFAPFIEKVSKEPLDEAKVNNLEITEEMPIETFFEKDEYRILIVANKFTQGFDEPLLCAMYLDKYVKGVNAVQTISRLNRNYEGKNATVVIDFTDNSKEIFKAFNKYRTGIKIRETEPDPSEMQKLYDEIQEYNLFNTEQIEKYLNTAKEGDDAAFATLALQYRLHFESIIQGKEERSTFVNLLIKYVHRYNFYCQFVEFNDTLSRFAIFADLIYGKLIKIGSESSLKKSLESVIVSKAAIKYIGEKENPNRVSEPQSTGHGTGAPPPRATIEDVLEAIRKTFTIEENDVVVIKQVYDETMKDQDLQNLIGANSTNQDFLKQTVAPQLRKKIIDLYRKKGLIRKTLEMQYKAAGGIFDLLVQNIIRHSMYRFVS
jgi:type I restriction enzyme R subunit